jgi:hypothetical protein
MLWAGDVSPGDVSYGDVSHDDVSPGDVLPAGGPVSFTAISGATTGLELIVLHWKAAETELQGGTLGRWWLWGLNVFDYDQDGDPDLTLTPHGGWLQIIRNNGT